MSEHHARTIFKIRQEFRAAVEGAAIVRREYDALGPVSSRDAVGLVEVNAERTYYVRLCADVERMLHRHLGDHFRFDGLADPKRATADELLDAVRYRLRPGTLREVPLDKHRDARRAYAYRNRLAHGDRSDQAPVSLASAFTIFEALVLELPNMAE